MNYIMLGIFGLAGIFSRYFINTICEKRFPNFAPWHTFTINVLGCFLIGVAYNYFSKANLSPEWRLAVMTGFLGGFTTFSAYSLESWLLIEDNQMARAVTYIGGSVLFGIAATIVGYTISKGAFIK